MVDNTGGRMREKAAREALEAAREAEGRAYRRMGDAAFTERQRGIMELVELEKTAAPGRELLDQKCRLLLESFYLPHILEDGGAVELDKAFTRSGDAGRDYIEAVFTDPSGRKRSVGYNYKLDEDEKSLILFEKTFENVIVKPGEPGKYVLPAKDGITEPQELSVEELQERLAQGEIVKTEDGYFLKARDESGGLCKGETTVLVEAGAGDGNVRIALGDHEQERYSVSKTGQLLCAVTNDVITVTVESRKFAGEGPVYDSAEAARAAAEKELREGETNLRVDTVMEGTTVAEFDFVPVYTTSVELAGISKKLGKGVEGYDASESDEENLRRQFAKPISEYLEEKGFHIISISCEGLQSDVTENVGWMNTIKTFQMTGGVVTVAYTKRYTATVNLKQGFLGRGQNNDLSAVLSQLPEGSELLDPQGIDWKNARPEVSYVIRGSVTAEGSARTVAEADKLAVENAVVAAQKIAVRGLNGGISAGIKEAIYANRAVSTVASARARMDAVSVSREDMRLSHKDTRYTYTGSCDREVTSVEHKMVSVTSWDGSRLTFVEPTDPVIDKGIPTDDNYDKYVSEGDDAGILVFERTDPGLRRYIDEVQNAWIQAEHSRKAYEDTRAALREAQETFDRIYDEGKESAQKESPQKESTRNDGQAVPAKTETKRAEEPESPMTAHEALLAIFGDDGTE